MQGEQEDVLSTGSKQTLWEEYLCKLLCRTEFFSSCHSCTSMFRATRQHIHNIAHRITSWLQPREGCGSLIYHAHKPSSFPDPNLNINWLMRSPQILHLHKVCLQKRCIVFETVATGMYMCLHTCVRHTQACITDTVLCSVHCNRDLCPRKLSANPTDPFPIQYTGTAQLSYLHS